VPSSVPLTESACPGNERSSGFRALLIEAAGRRYDVQRSTSQASSSAYFETHSSTQGCLRQAMLYRPAAPSNARCPALRPSDKRCQHRQPDTDAMSSSGDAQILGMVGIWLRVQVGVSRGHVQVHPACGCYKSPRSTRLRIFESEFKSSSRLLVRDGSVVVATLAIIDRGRTIKHRG